MEVIAAIGLFTVLAVAALRFGSDSRERYVSNEERLARRGYRWDDRLTDEVLAAELMAARAYREPAVPRHGATVPVVANLRPTEA